MTVEIKELIIRASVNEPDAPLAEPAIESFTPVDMDRIVDACVRRVMRIWRRKRER